MLTVDDLTADVTEIFQTPVGETSSSRNAMRESRNLHLGVYKSACVRYGGELGRAGFRYPWCSLVRSDILSSDSNQVTLIPRRKRTPT